MTRFCTVVYRQVENSKCLNLMERLDSVLKLLETLTIDYQSIAQNFVIVTLVRSNSLQLMALLV